jgi:dihydrofolate reductase
MRKLIVVNIVSLDGFYEGPKKNVMVLPMDGSFDKYNLERMKAASTVLLGGNSYKMFSGFWPTVEHEESMPATNRQFSKLYNAIDKVVVSNHAAPPPKDHPWAKNTRIIKRAGAHEEIAKLKETKGKEIVMYGSRTLWNDLLLHGLVDELHLIVGAVILGGGTPILKNHSVALKRLDTRPLADSDNVLGRYEVLKTDEES